MIIPSHMGPARWSKAEGRYQVDHPGIMGAAGLTCSGATGSQVVMECMLIGCAGSKKATKP